MVINYNHYQELYTNRDTMIFHSLLKTTYQSIIPTLDFQQSGASSKFGQATTGYGVAVTF